MLQESDEKVKIEGMKLSCELFAIRLREPTRAGDLPASLCRMLADNKVNIGFLSIASTRSETVVTCCVSAEDQDQAMELIACRPTIAAGAVFLPSVGLLSLFPHRSSCRLLGLSLSALLREAIPIHGMGSSLSMLTFITDYVCLEKAVDVLRKRLEVPPDHVPLRAPMRAKQTDIFKEDDT